MDDFEGKVAVVTGAASGIGRGLAETFVAAGMRVVLSDVEEPALRASTAEFASGGADVHAVVTDVSDTDAVTALADATLRRYGAVHVVCNNAGVYTGSRPSWTSTLDDWSWILGVNLMGVVHGIRSFLPIMIEQGGEAHLVNTASLAGFITGGSLYGVTKSAVVALSETVHLELVAGGYEPRISVLCPGVVDSNIFDSERNRPARFADAGPAPGGWSKEAARDSFRQGLSPRSVGEQTLRAIREQRFHIFTRPEYPPHAEHIRHRTAQILNEENPTRLPFA
ncbi:SDR family NAD(P)-dependent oxidoreductase [Amycolatopsis sp. CA-230715]|uniref:SDR family NAD(P)-dependent oxidoreductase n=1 Tax=Amycolatopsis sp. CA-230715 TaxID=2745196 RepID=UPI001C018B85|nr:SDR family NAD(P)-dependent oxidoreductase [Amycolatopsis sp. CA-230715]QWF85012.1 3-phenylpropionate-dihydrodiol/cinnamic acid-dihydrodiol dehydrogenase [Amycolatopsis sp. CA-230715]